MHPLREWFPGKLKHLYDLTEKSAPPENRRNALSGSAAQMSRSAGELCGAAFAFYAPIMAFRMPFTSRNVMELTKFSSLLP